MSCGAGIVRRRSIAHHPDEKCIMKRSRLTREQRKSETRERIINAARTIFIEDGFADASLENITETAGYTRGAFYANFENKRELLIELLRRDHGRMLSDLLAITADSVPDELASRAVEYYAKSFRDCDCFPIWFEAKLLAIRDDEIRAVLNTLWLEQLSLFRTCMRAGQECVDASFPMKANATFFGLLCLCVGNRFARMYDRESMSDEMTDALLNALITSMFSRRPHTSMHDR